MEFQHTVVTAFEITGKALHTGATVKMRITPQPENTGIWFSRSDLPGFPKIKAEPGAVVDTKKSMTLGRDGWRIATIEHLMAVFHGLGVDNVLVEVDGAELPQGDCSGLFFTEELLRVGLRKQSEPRHYYYVKEPVWVEGVVPRGNQPYKAWIVALPSNEFRVSFTFTSDHPVTGTQYYQYEHTAENFVAEVAPARTIAFRREIEYLQSQGLALGGDINSVVVVGDHGYENELRFPEEIARHKILDILGDLYLVGPLRGHIIAIRSGHSLDLELARKMTKELGS